MPPTYASDTAVPVEKSKEEIARLLRQWGCIGLQWTENWKQSNAQLRFCWPHNGVEYIVRLSLVFPTDAEMERTCTIRHKTRDARLAWLDKEREQTARAIYRIVLIKLKADFNMVSAKMATVVEVFLPFLEDAQGRTVAEIATPRLPELLGPDGGQRLFPPPGATTAPSR